jgi:hypothetical protein
LSLPRLPIPPQGLLDFVGFLVALVCCVYDPSIFNAVLAHQTRPTPGKSPIFGLMSTPAIRDLAKFDGYIALEQLQDRTRRTATIAPTAEAA